MSSENFVVYDRFYRKHCSNFSWRSRISEEYKKRFLDLILSGSILTLTKENEISYITLEEVSTTKKELNEHSRRYRI